MNDRRLAALACVALGFFACKKESPAPPPKPVEEAKPAAPPPAPAATPRQDFPATESTLSLLEPASGHCEWLKQDPLGEGRLIATFEGDCLGGEVALSRDGKRGAVRFNPNSTHGTSLGTPAFPEPIVAKGMKDRLFEVDLAAGTTRAVPVPTEGGDFVDFGFDSKGRLIALTLRRPTTEETRAGELRVAGTAVNLEEAKGEGEVAVGVAFSYEGGAWKQVELKLTTEGTDVSLGIRALRVADDLGYRSIDALESRVQGDNEVQNAVLDALRAYAPQLNETDGSWIRLGYAGHKVDVWEVNSEIPFSTGLIAFIEKNAPVKPANYPYTEADVVAIRTRGQYLLVAQDEVGAHPRMYRGTQHVWGSDTARAVTFWPGK